MLRASGKAAYRIPSAAAALGILIRAAVDTLTAPGGPAVSVEISHDIQRTVIKRRRRWKPWFCRCPNPQSLTEKELSGISSL